MPLAPPHDRPHVPGHTPGWAETWGFQLAGDRLTGLVRLTRVTSLGACWCWTLLRGDDVGIVVVRDDEVTPPRRPESLEVRGDDLWMELVCETPFEHWGIGLEAFGLRVDTPSDEIGERLPLGLDLEWETDGTPVSEQGDAGYVQEGIIHGEVLIADERIPYEAPCTRDHAWGAINLPSWPS
jgi:hypothetical protein